MVGQSVAPFTGADGNGDGVVDQADYAVWRSHFGETFLPGPGAGAGALLAGDGGSATGGSSGGVAAALRRGFVAARMSADPLMVKRRSRPDRRAVALRPSARRSIPASLCSSDSFAYVATNGDVSTVLRSNAGLSQRTVSELPRRRAQICCCSIWRGQASTTSSYDFADESLLRQLSDEETHVSDLALAAVHEGRIGFVGRDLTTAVNL